MPDHHTHHDPAVQQRIAEARAQGAQLVLATVEELHAGTHMCANGNWYTQNPNYEGAVARREPCPTLASARDAANQAGDAS